jgi:RNA polymerase sigma factor (sigma-70 family)
MQEKIPDDETILQSCLQGDKSAWELFVSRYSRLIYFSIKTVFKNKSYRFQPQDLENLHNDVFVSLLKENYKKLRQFKGKNGCTLASWLRMIATRITLDFLGKQKSFISLDEPDEKGKAPRESLPNSKKSAEELLARSQDIQKLKKVIQSLPARDQLFIELYYYRGLDPKQIARIFNVSINTVYSIKSRLKERIKKVLTD